MKRARSKCQQKNQQILLNVLINFVWLFNIRNIMYQIITHQSTVLLCMISGLKSYILVNLGTRHKFEICINFTEVCFSSLHNTALWTQYYVDLKQRSTKRKYCVLSYQRQIAFHYVWSSRANRPTSTYVLFNDYVLYHRSSYNTLQ